MVNSITGYPPQLGAETSGDQDASNGKKLATPGAKSKEVESQSTAQKSIFIDANKKPEQFRNYGQDTPRYETVRAFYEEQHAKQTYDFATSMRKKYTSSSRCTMPVWDALMYLNGVVDDSDPDTDMDQLAHAVQTAEAARKAYPGDEYDWLHVTAFIHDLGKIMAVKEKGFEGLPQWAVVGDNFPLGCAFNKGIVFHEYFKANPDASDPRYNTELGIYGEGCGLEKVTFSWSHDEYLFHIAKNQSKLPKEALAILRYHSFYCLHHMGGYEYLLSKEDHTMLPWIKRFQKFDLYSKSTELPKFHEITDYYKEKLNKYFPNPVHW